MSSDDFARLKAILVAAMELPAEEREAYLDASCGDDAELRANVEAKLRHLDQDHALLRTDGVDDLLGHLGAVEPPSPDADRRSRGGENAPPRNVDETTVTEGSAAHSRSDRIGP